MSPEQETQFGKEELESLEREKRTETPAREKTPEELRAENIERLAQRAKQFIAEKKEEKEKEEIRQRISETEMAEIAEDRQEQESFKPKSKGVVASIENKYRLAVLKMKRVENPQAMLRLINYFEERMPVSKSVNVPKNKVEREKEKYLKKGYNLESEREGDFGKVSLRFKKDSHGYKFDQSNIKDLAKLTNRPADAIEVLEELRKIGEVSYFLATLYSDSLGKLLQIPNVISIFKKISRLGIDCGYLASWEKMDGLIELVEQESSHPVITPQVEKRLVTMAAAIGKKEMYSISSLKTLLNIAQREDRVKLVPVLMEGGYIDSAFRNIKRVEAFQDRELAESLISTYRKGVSLDLFEFFSAYDSYQYRKDEESKKYYEEQVKKLKGELNNSTLKMMSSDEGVKDNIENVLTLLGGRCNIRELGCASAIGRDPRGMALLEFLREAQLLPSQKGGFALRGDSLESIFSLLGNSEFMDLVFQPDFQRFVVAVKRNFPDKIKPSTLGCATYEGQYNPLVVMYRDDYLRRRLLTPEGVEITNYVCQSSLPYISSLGYLKEMLLQPDIMSTLKSLETYLGYRYDINSGQESAEMIINSF